MELLPEPGFRVAGEEFAGAGSAMIGFGDALRAERERLGLSVDAVSDRTKVPSHHLLAVEAGEWTRLPGGVFRRGILKAYLGALGLAESPEWTDRMRQCLREAGDPDGDWSTFAENVRRSRAGRAGGRSGLRWLGVLLMLLALLAAAYALWHYLLEPRLR